MKKPPTGGGQVVSRWDGVFLFDVDGSHGIHKVSDKNRSQRVICIRIKQAVSLAQTLSEEWRSPFTYSETLLYRRRPDFCSTTVTLCQVSASKRRGTSKQTTPSDVVTPLRRSKAQSKKKTNHFMIILNYIAQFF